MCTAVSSDRMYDGPSQCGAQARKALGTSGLSLASDATSSSKNPNGTIATSAYYPAVLAAWPEHTRVGPGTTGRGHTRPRHNPGTHQASTRSQCRSPLKQGSPVKTEAAPREKYS